MRKYMSPMAGFLIIVAVAFYGWYVVEDRHDDELRQNVIQLTEQVKQLQLRKTGLEQELTEARASAVILCRDFITGNPDLPSASVTSVKMAYQQHFDKPLFPDEEKPEGETVAEAETEAVAEAETPETTETTETK